MAHKAHQNLVFKLLPAVQEGLLAVLLHSQRQVLLRRVLVKVVYRLLLVLVVLALHLRAVVEHITIVTVIGTVALVADTLGFFYRLSRKAILFWLLALEAVEAALKVPTLLVAGLVAVALAVQV